MLRCFLNIDRPTSTYTMAFFVYRVKLNPSDDAHVEYFGLGFGIEVKMLTEDEANALREMIKDEVGKTVGRVGDGEQYEILSSFPNIHDIHTFVHRVTDKWVSFNTYYSKKYNEKVKRENRTATTATTVTTATTTYQCSPAMATCDGLYDPPL